MVVFHVERMTERKHKGGLCGSPDILFLDLGLATQVWSIWENIFIKRVYVTLLSVNQMIKINSWLNTFEY